MEASCSLWTSIPVGALGLLYVKNKLHERLGQLAGQAPVDAFQKCMDNETKILYTKLRVRLQQHDEPLVSVRFLCVLLHLDHLQAIIGHGKTDELRNFRGTR